MGVNWEDITREEREREFFFFLFVSAFIACSKERELGGEDPTLPFHNICSEKRGGGKRRKRTHGGPSPLSVPLPR